MLKEAPQMALRMKPHSTAGMLITFCGLDGCGKTIMLDRLYTYLCETGHPCLRTKQPTDAVRQLDIFRTFMDCEDNSGYDYRSLSLLAAGDRVQHANRVILPALQAGRIVLRRPVFLFLLGKSPSEGIYERPMDIRSGRIYSAAGYCLLFGCGC